MFRRIIYYVVTLFVAILSGCGVNPVAVTVNPNTYEMPQIIGWSGESKTSPIDTAGLWLREAKKRFNNPIIFYYHGQYEEVVYSVKDSSGKYVTTVKTEWYLYPDPPRMKMSAREAALFLHNAYPDRDIVMVVCNRKGFTIDIPRVWISPSIVWKAPDDTMNEVIPFMRHETVVNRDGVGSIWEFSAAPNKKDQASFISVDLPAIPTTKPTTRPLQPSTQPSPTTRGS